MRRALAFENLVAAFFAQAGDLIDVALGIGRSYDRFRIDARHRAQQFGGEQDIVIGITFVSNSMPGK